MKLSSVTCIFMLFAGSLKVKVPSGVDKTSCGTFKCFEAYALMNSRASFWRRSERDLFSSDCWSSVR